jgi:hypothetical protein
MNNITYEQLYNNMVNKFTVEKDNQDYKLGEYMLMKAKAKREAAMVAVSEKPALPVVRTKSNATGAIAAAFSYVNDKLTVKEAPVRDKTLRAFPLRTSLTAFCSALVVCGLVVCCSIFGIKGNVAGNDNVIRAEQVAEITEENAELTYTTEQN